MPLILPIFLLALPLIEIAGFVLVGDLLGVWGTLLATLATAMLGLFTLRFQIASLPARARAAFATDQPPVAEAMIELLRALGGVLLLLPGFFTDLMGFLLLVPAVRLGVLYVVLSRLSAHRSGAHRTEQDDSIIDVSYTDVTPAPTDRQVDDGDDDSDRDDGDHGRGQTGGTGAR